LRLPSDPAVTGDALAYGLFSHWQVTKVSFNLPARQACRAHAEPPGYQPGTGRFPLEGWFSFGMVSYHVVDMRSQSCVAM
ncbi:MAG: hypothetical protein ACOYEP_04160, partial [Limnochordia bacterium]